MPRIAKEWKPVAGYDGTYSVSNKGEIRSETRLVQSVVRGKPVTRKLRRKPLMVHVANGVATVALGGRGSVMVRRLVAQAFLPPPAPGYTQVANKDGNPANNAATNLEWRKPHVTRTGPHNPRRGENAARAKLTAKQVRAIFDAYFTTTATSTALAQKYGVSTSAVSAILSGRSWNHVTGLEKPVTP